MQTRLPCVDEGAMAGDVAVDIRDGVGCRSGHAGPKGQWPSRYALHTGISAARPNPYVFLRKEEKEKSKLGSRGVLGVTIRSAVE